MNNTKAQSTLVYVALIGFIIAGLVTVSFYIKRSIQGRIRESADTFGGGAQYQPGETEIIK